MLKFAGKFRNFSTNFKLDRDFVSMYAEGKPNFGFNGLGEIAYIRSYARFREDLGRQERWHETVNRVVDGCFTMQKRHMVRNDLKWHE